MTPPSKVGRRTIIILAWIVNPTGVHYWHMQNIFLGLTRISLGFIFFWAFIDKVFGFGFATKAGQAWIDGVSPTYGYLAFATQGPFASIFQAIAGNALVDILFMAGLLGIGLALILGINIKFASFAGVLMLLLMYFSVLPKEHNPLIDDHIIYSLILLSFTQMPVGEYLGLGKWWAQQPLVKKYSWLK